ncbi:hypothetical protein SBBP1_900017 [Burkholderiales bacterium]|nr:hypothetical protein SBBP1_900017 [Burkholderiales bacterium]
MLAVVFPAEATLLAAVPDVAPAVPADGAVWPAPELAVTEVLDEALAGVTPSFANRS